MEAGIQTVGSDSRHSQRPCGGQEFLDHFVFFPSYPDSVHRICLVTTGVETSRSGSQWHFVLWVRCSVLLRQLKSSHEWEQQHYYDSNLHIGSCDELPCATAGEGNKTTAVLCSI